jgi:phage tail protein X
MAITYRTRDGDMLDEICWRHYGVQSGAVEPVLDLNPGLADRGPVYASGVLITLPDLAAPQVAGPVRLWD